MPHIHEKIDFTAETFIVHHDRVLLRLHDKYGLWLGVGGHVELDEDPNEAAVREAREEVGLEVKLAGAAVQTEPDNPGFTDLIPPRFLNRHAIDGSHEHVSLVYFALSESDDVRPTGDDRSDTWRWFSADELDDSGFDLPGHVRFYAKEALKELGSKSA